MARSLAAGSRRILSPSSGLSSLFFERCAHSDFSLSRYVAKRHVRRKPSIHAGC